MLHHSPPVPPCDTGQAQVFSGAGIITLQDHTLIYSALFLNSVSVLQLLLFFSTQPAVWDFAGWVFQALQILIPYSCSWFPMLWEPFLCSIHYLKNGKQTQALRRLFTTQTLHYMAPFLAGALNRNISLGEKKINPVVNDQIPSLALADRLFFFRKLRHWILLAYILCR